MLRTLIAKSIVAIAAASLAGISHAGVATSTKVVQLIMYSGPTQVSFTISGSSQPSSGRIWFDASTVNGQNLLATITAANLAGKSIYVSWFDTPDPNILGVPSNAMAALTVLP